MQDNSIHDCATINLLTEKLSLSELDELKILNNHMINGTLSDRINDVTTSVALIKIQEIMLDKANEQKKNRTGMLWIQFLDMAAIIRKFIKGERTGNWQLHLQSVYEMLPYFAAAGHNNYLKSTYLYFQNMIKLKNTHPNVERQFQDGYHVIRKTDRFWAGRSADLVIEQDFMRTMKSSGTFNCHRIEFYFVNSIFIFLNI